MTDLEKEEILLALAEVLKRPIYLIDNITKDMSIETYTRLKVIGGVSRGGVVGGTFDRGDVNCAPAYKGGQSVFGSSPLGQSGRRLCQPQRRKPRSVRKKVKID